MSPGCAAGAESVVDDAIKASVISIIFDVICMLPMVAPGEAMVADIPRPVPVGLYPINFGIKLT